MSSNAQVYILYIISSSSIIFISKFFGQCSKGAEGGRIHQSGMPPNPLPGLRAPAVNHFGHASMNGMAKDKKIFVFWELFLE